MVQLFRLAVLAVVIWLVIRLVQNAYRRTAASTKRRAPARARSEIATMVRCAHCGVHLPRDEAVAADERYYCSRGHLAADRHSGDGN
jgi:uncharacterized protein